MARITSASARGVPGLRERIDRRMRGEGARSATVSPATLPRIYSSSSGMLTNSSGSSSPRGSTMPSVSWPVT